MARRPRRDAPGVAHHVMVRGIERRRIFRSNDDRRDFVKRLDRLIPEEQWRCFAWALMPNHVHLVLQSTRGGLSRLMARLNTGYARGFNRRHSRTGYLFQNRFKSRVVEDDEDLMGLVLYVHRNPLVAGLVASVDALERDPWSGCGALAGIREPRRFESVSETLVLFADCPDEARRRVRARMSDPIELAFESALDAPACKGVGTPSETPEPSDPEQIRSAESDVKTIEVPTGGSADGHLCALVSGVSRWMGVPIADICSASPRRVPARARAAVAYLAVVELGILTRPTAAALGISRSAVSHALRRGKAAVQEERLRAVQKPTLPQP